jgi:hypothetical protein
MCRLPLQAIEQITASDLPFLATAWQRTCAVNQPLSINAEHAHLSHCTDERSIPCALAGCKSVEWDSSDWIL